MTDKMLMRNIYPRLFACAERAANPKPNFVTADTAEFHEEWELFVRKLPKYVKDLEASEISYRIPVPGVNEAGLMNTQVRKYIPLSHFC
jgi:hypothetical protein